MLIESSAATIRSTLSRMLVDFQVGGHHREELALDIIEFIALQLKNRDDAHVFNLGLFVRTNLAGFLSCRIDRSLLQERLTAAALAGREGLAPFLKAIHVRCER